LQYCSDTRGDVQLYYRGYFFIKMHRTQATSFYIFDDPLFTCNTSTMAKEQHPTYSNGKICYLEIPSVDPAQSAAFYADVFGWKSRRRDDGALAFDDSVGEVSGAWVTGREPIDTAGLMVYIMVDDIKVSIELVEKHGGIIVQPLGADAPELTARFTDPTGNIFGLYQEPVQTPKQ